MDDDTMHTEDASAADQDAASDESTEDAAMASRGEPGLDCDQTCEKITEPGCESGPPSISICVTICEALTTGDEETCREAFQAVLDCFDPAEVLECDEDGRVQPTTMCFAEWDTLQPCLPL